MENREPSECSLTLDGGRETCTGDSGGRGDGRRARDEAVSVINRQEMHISTTVSCPSTPIRMAETPVTAPNYGEDSARGSLIYAGRDCKLVQPLWKAVWQFLIKLNIQLPYAQCLHLWTYDPRWHPCLKYVKLTFTKNLCSGCL